jgi:hypothetical protein
MRGRKQYDAGKRVLQRLKRSTAAPVDRIVVFDIETWGLEATRQSFALGVLCYQRNGELVYERFTSASALLARLLSRQFRDFNIYAHNGSRFDFYAVFDGCYHDFFAGDDDQLIVNHGRFIMAAKCVSKQRDNAGKWKRRYVHFYDSFNVLQSSAEAWGHAMGYPKGQTPEKFKAGVPCAVNEDDWLYCERDCDVIFKSLAFVFTHAGAFAPTIASLAMKNWRLFHQREDYFIPEDIDLLAREAYLGARTEPIFFGEVVCNSYDVNSFYPDAMTHQTFINPTTATRIDAPTVARAVSLMRDHEGFIRAMVTHRDGVIYGELAARHDDGGTVFPTGTFTVSVPFDEMRAALASGNVSINAVDWIIYGAPLKYSPFRSYVEQWYKMKSDAKRDKKPAVELLAKLMLNALYGKFGSVKRTDDRYFNDEAAYRRWAARAAREAGISVAAFEDTLTRTNYDERCTRFSISVPTASDEIEFSYTCCMWSAQITSYCRVHLLAAAKKYNYLYMDTDSGKTTATLPAAMVSDYELGKWKLEGEGKPCIIRGSKDYIYDGEEHIKGVPKRKKGEPAADYARRVRRDDAGNIRYNAVLQERAALRRGVKPGASYERSLSLSRDVRKRIVFPNGQSVPCRIEADGSLTCGRRARTVPKLYIRAGASR